MDSRPRRFNNSFYRSRQQQELSDHTGLQQPCVNLQMGVQRTDQERRHWVHLLGVVDCIQLWKQD